MDNIRTENFLGSNKIIVGNKYTDLILETLGKVYIKTGNNSIVLSDILKLLDKTSEEEIKSLTIIVNSLLEMQGMEYPGDGFFIYNTLNSVLYISYDNRYIALIESLKSKDERYVRRSGDTMSGLLEINTVGPPLIVASSKLIRNLNSEYINGYSSNDLAKKRLDEYITGDWTFRGKCTSENKWIFKDNIRAYGDLITSKNITSPEFASGFGGYGWKLDGDTNTLTIDYLVVRKAMRVYEMVINKINATNGSLWVSNSSKCENAVLPIILTGTELSSIPNWQATDENIDAALKILKSNTYYLPIPNSGENLTSITLKSELSGPSEINTISKTFFDYKFIIYIKDPVGLVSNPLFAGLLTLYDELLLTSNNGDLDHTNLTKCISLYYINNVNKKFPFYIIPKGTETESGKLYTELYENATSLSEALKYIFTIYPYYKYFAVDSNIMGEAIAQADLQYGNIPLTVVPNLWVISTDDDEYPLFKPGDIIRCLKYTNGNIKYYDAIIMSLIETRLFIAQKANSVFDKYTKIIYNKDGSVQEYKEDYNNTLYSKTELSYNSETGQIEPDSESNTIEARLDDIAKGDDMIQIGNILDLSRLNSIYLTSCDDDGPFIDVISGLNRPDYSVLYDTPIYRRHIYVAEKDNFEYNKRQYNYYILETEPTIDYIYPIIIKDKSYYGTIYPTKESELIIKDKKYRHAYTKTTRVRVGNLDGIYNEVFGNKQPYGFGLYGENVFLTGEFYLNNGTSIVDFSEESILLKFRNAGLEIRDVIKEDGTIDQVPALNLEGEPILDENGNPTYRNKTEIYMNADQFIFSIAGHPAMSLNGLFDKDTGQILNTFLDVQGWIQSNGLYIYPKGYESDPNNPIEGASSYITDEGKLVADGAYFTNCDVSGKITASEGKIGIFNINSNGLYYGDIHRWGNESYKQDMALVTPGSVRLQRQRGYFSAGDIANLKVGIGDYSDPFLQALGGDLAACASAGYFYRQMNTGLGGSWDSLNEYYPAVKIISDNVINRDIALYTEGGIVCKGGIIETGRTMPDSVTVIDLSFGCNILVQNTTYKLIYLPRLDNVRKVIGYKPGEDFCIRITIILRYDSTQNAFVAFPDGETSLYFVNNNGDKYSDRIEMGRGDVLELALIYSNNNYYAQVINRRT